MNIEGNELKFCGFLIVTIALFSLIIVYLYRLIFDIKAYHDGKLGSKSQHKKLLRTQKTIHNTTQTNLFKDNCLIKWIQNLHKLYNIHFKVDSGLWCSKKLLTEIFEIFVQTIALLYYNGYIVLGSDDEVALAHEPKYIKLFAIFLSMNCLCSCIIWLFYAFKPLICHGFVFAIVLYTTDVIFDMFYTLFPLIVVFESRPDIMVALASLQTDDQLNNYFLFYIFVTG